ncbi:EspA/EspE family type VII secretion system effector [Mycolicibacterium sp. 050232]|uniref:EspA/EspE family type VII secretion system effector n=1 Tax=Mycolicibacterium sp. 050232 TaxID=3113982 RepID=UPI002E2E1343|nr:EspA/EspE family type VII secretion system effector [Mycolicibacterium sp. 050232]MED5815002.1 EspA/EspE family type VII secretion system effector [Mycolicibacterium sp. 050232]
MGVGSFYYLQGNYVYGIADHANGAKSSVPWAMAGIGSDFLSMGQLVATEGAGALAKSAAASGATSSAKALGNIAKGAGTPIINAGLIVLTMESNMLGFGRPEDGARFTEGANHFVDAHSTLLRSAPPGDWTGDASKAYGDRNKEQQARAADMSSTDSAIQKVVADEARQVGDTRDFVSQMQTILSLSIVPALLAKATPVVGPALSTAIEVAAVAGTVPAATIQCHQMASRSGENAGKIKDLASRYESTNANAKIPGGGFGQS